MICLITATGGRPDQFAMCMAFMKRQTYKGEVVWIIIDDVMPVSTSGVKSDFREDWIIIKGHPKPSWLVGQNTQFRNMLMATKALLGNYSPEDIEGIFIIEDDDYYKPDYLEKMMTRLDGYEIAGEINSLYYNVYHRSYFAWGNVLHASLFQTAFKPSIIPYLDKVCLNPSPYPNYYIDVQLWHEATRNKNLFKADNLAIGIKGMPGRAGIGAGHDGGFMVNKDVDCSYLKSLIGSDVSLYEKYYLRVFPPPQVITPQINRRTIRRTAVSSYRRR